jgi:Holliday junction resolvase RusA-like endonuclease
MSKLEDRPDYFCRSFLLGLEPIRTTHQADLRILRTRDGRQFIGKTSKSAIKAWKAEFVRLCRPYAPDRPYEGPLEVSLYFGFPCIKSDEGKSRPMCTKPDFDNLAKSAMDGLVEAGFMHDDCQVVLGRVAKFRTKHPFVAIDVGSFPHIDDLFVAMIRQNHENGRK